VVSHSQTNTGVVRLTELIVHLPARRDKSRPGVPVEPKEKKPECFGPGANPNRVTQPLIAKMARDGNDRKDGW
jgi:hypothetical protein